VDFGGKCFGAKLKNHNLYFLGHDNECVEGGGVVRNLFNGTLKERPRFELDVVKCEYSLREDIRMVRDHQDGGVGVGSCIYTCFAHDTLPPLPRLVHRPRVTVSDSHLPGCASAAGFLTSSGTNCFASASIRATCTASHTPIVLSPSPRSDSRSGC
jgi:hypothetical protein